mmetsp:Transcript_10683/g.29684  ORF Transcript_10683/g.29684 Transcript_10683/m.29684 type:complete len:242 (-) Transcript_10683:479-1204(-)
MPRTILFRCLCMFEDLMLASVALRRVLVSSPTYTATHTTHGVFFNMQPRGRKFTSPPGYLSGPSRTSAFTSLIVGSGALSKIDKPPPTIFFVNASASFSSSVALARVTAKADRSDVALEMPCSPSMCTLPKTTGARFSFRFVSPSKFAVEMKASWPPAARSRMRSAGKVESQETYSKSPHKTSFHMTSIHVRFLWSYRNVCLVFSFLSSRRRCKSSKRSFKAVHARTDMKGKTLLGHNNGE